MISAVVYLAFKDVSGFWLNFGVYISPIATISIILVVFRILLGGKYEDKWRWLISLLLIMMGLALAVVSPFSQGWNTLMIGALFSPLIAYIVGILKANKKFSDEVDRVSYDYRWKQVETESNIIGELLGELSTHAAAFKSYGFQEIEYEKWKSSFKVGLISDIHTLLVARYYYFVPIYNRIVKNLKELMEQESEEKTKHCLCDFLEVKKAFLETETAIFHTLIYDLGLLQQTYLARPTVQFPLHLNLLLRRRLENFDILRKSDEANIKKIFSPKNLERFNLKMVAHLNFCYANIGTKVKAIDRKIDEIKKANKK